MVLLIEFMFRLCNLSVSCSITLLNLPLVEFLKSLFDHVLPSYALQEGRKWYSSSYQFWTNALVNTPNCPPTSDLTIPATLWRSCLLEYKHVHAQYLTLPGRAVSCYIHQWIDKLVSWTLLWSSLTSLSGYHELTTQILKTVIYLF